jgi:hypothetical protein
LMQRAALRLMARGRTTVLHSTIFEFIRMPATLRATLAMFSGKERPFVVTAKGRDGASRSRMPVPRLLVLLVLASVGALVWFPLSIMGDTPVHYRHVWMPAGALVWVVFNLVMLLLAIARIRRVDFGAERRGSVRFTLASEADLDGFATEVEDVSLTGARLTSSQVVPWQPGATVTMVLRLPTGPLRLPATVRLALDRPDGGMLLGVEFTGISMADEGRLALALFRTAALVDPNLDVPDTVLANSTQTVYPNQDASLFPPNAPFADETTPSRPDAMPLSEAS